LANLEHGEKAVRMRTVGSLGMATLALLSGCAGRTPEAQGPKERPVHPVAMTAQFDLNCPRSELRYQKLGEGHWGAVGCGKRARYRCEREANKAVAKQTTSGVESTFLYSEASLGAGESRDDRRRIGRGKVISRRGRWRALNRLVENTGLALHPAPVTNCHKCALWSVRAAAVARAAPGIQKEKLALAGVEPGSRARRTGS
jgi:hypothetical protein